MNERRAALGSLGMHKYGKTALMAASSFAGDSPLFVLDYLLRLLRVVVMLSLWQMIFDGAAVGDGAVSGMTLAAVLTYALVAEVFAEQLSCRTELSTALWQGTIGRYFLQPIGMVGQFAAEMCGRWLFGFAAFSLPLLLLSPVLGVDPRPASVGAGALFVVSLGLGITVGLAVEFLFGGLVVALEQPVWAIMQVRRAVTALLSGAVVPLALLPWELGDALGLLPFAAMASAPLRIYTGTGDPLWLMLMQLGWAIVLWPLVGWLWRANREKMVSYGG